jgi:hypothetical protein
MKMDGLSQISYLYGEMTTLKTTTFDQKNIPNFYNNLALEFIFTLSLMGCFFQCNLQ